MKALIFLAFVAGHHHQQLGDGAVGAPELLAIEDVVRRRASASAVVLHRGRIGADLGSVRAKAEIAPLAQPRQVLLLLLRVPNSLSGCGTPIDWRAESRAVRLPSTLVTRPIAWV